MQNRLAGETSPYLLQHADNPVDWYPWGEEALDLARRERKPILLSIGYSACHWCHVMAHESFEDRKVAEVMNASFVNIKVDREERPDLDQIYQSAHALLTRRSGGWPLTMFLTPEGVPFFGGTYFPKASRYGLPGFVDLLPQVAAAFREQGAAIAEHGAQLREALASLEPMPGDTPALPIGSRAILLADLKRSFDRVYGGFGKAPKFPHTTDLDLCLREYVRADDAQALEVVRVTLEGMANGGIHDQLGGGFCRYSVDAEWVIPHFEKMLYDNGPLLALYADLARVSGEKRFAEVAMAIVGWMMREMQAADGAFYSSLDADSEGEEGKFYVWSREEVRSLLLPETYSIAAAHYGLDGPPNFEEHAWNLCLKATPAQLAARFNVSERDIDSRIASAKTILFGAREKRVRPGLDDKILTSWNALTIGALARAARVLDQPSWADAATAAVDTLRQTAWRDGRLLATRKGDRAHLNAYLDDYAFLIAALVELLQTRFRIDDYQWARSLADVLLSEFEDPERGGFFFTRHDHEPLFHRTKPGHDNATPSGNGVAAKSLILLGHLCAEPRYVEAADRAVRLYTPALLESPAGFASIISALEDLEKPPTVVLLDGDRDICREWHSSLERKLRPSVHIFDVAGIALPRELARGSPTSGGSIAWVCRGAHCLPPLGSLSAIEEELLR